MCEIFCYFPKQLTVFLIIVFIQVKQLHAAISYKHKRMMDKEKADRDTTVGVAVGVGLTLAAVGLSFLLAGSKGRK